jgi:hypothetical protein
MKKSNRIKLIIIFIGLVSVILLIFTIPSKELETNVSSNRKIVTTYRSTIKNNPYSLHVAAGKKLSGKPFKNINEIEKAYKEGKMKKVTNSKGVIIDDLTHSKPYLQKEAAALLEELGREFYKANSGNRIVITSLTRPIEKQRELVKTNPVASPNTSSHSYGVSFDIAYTKFNRNRKYHHDSHKAIEEILKKYQAEKKILVIREKQSACYHVTVRR